MIQLQVDPEVEQRIVDAARARGLEPSVYAGQIVADAIRYTSPKHLTNEEFRMILDRLASRGENLPNLPDSAYTRESFYEDHD